MAVGRGSKRTAATAARRAVCVVCSAVLLVAAVLVVCLLDKQTPKEQVRGLGELWKTAWDAARWLSRACILPHFTHANTDASWGSIYNPNRR